MTEKQNQPREYDAVLGGESQVPLAAAILGGIPGVKSRLASPIFETKIAALSEAFKYGDAGLDLIVWALQNESMKVKLAVHSLLKDREDLKEKLQIQNYLPIFEFDVITVDAKGRENCRHTSSACFFTEDLGNGVVLEMVYIPGGTFMMGSPAREKGREGSESPQHQVTVTAFYAAKYPITQAQWQVVMGNNPSKFKGKKRPVENVTWDDAVKFCAKLSQKSGKKYRLLSEAEWEYACRAGTTTPFHFGETITPELVNYDGNKPYANAPEGLWPQETTDVDSFPSNAFGLYGMHGNVWEWCSDCWQPHYKGAPTDGSSWETATDTPQVLPGGFEVDTAQVYRGGSWLNSAVDCRSAIRTGAPAYWRNLHIGVRVGLIFA